MKGNKAGREIIIRLARNAEIVTEEETSHGCHHASEDDKGGDTPFIVWQRPADGSKTSSCHLAFDHLTTQPQLTKNLSGGGEIN